MSVVARCWRGDDRRAAGGRQAANLHSPSLYPCTMLPFESQKLLINPKKKKKKVCKIWRALKSELLSRAAVSRLQLILGNFLISTKVLLITLVAL